MFNADARRWIQGQLEDDITPLASFDLYVLSRISDERDENERDELSEVASNAHAYPFAASSAAQFRPKHTATEKGPS